jgi:hypothetical protein
MIGQVVFAYRRVHMRYRVAAAACMGAVALGAAPVVVGQATGSPNAVKINEAKVTKTGDLKVEFKIKCLSTQTNYWQLEVDQNSGPATETAGFAHNFSPGFKCTGKWQEFEVTVPKCTGAPHIDPSDFDDYFPCHSFVEGWADFRLWTADKTTNLGYTVLSKSMKVDD